MNITWLVLAGAVCIIVTCWLNWVVIPWLDGIPKRRTEAHTKRYRDWKKASNYDLLNK